nr:hypothetical protein [uncultured Mucilaginibacter sp.]
MKKALLLLLVLPFACKLSAQNYNEKYGSPLVVLIETDPWLMVIGSDVPSFAMYPNGQVIFKKWANKTVKYYEANLSREEVQKTITSFGITDSLMKQRRYIKASDWTDQPTNQLILNFDSVKVVNVYGDLRGKDGDVRKQTPKSFLAVYDKLIDFDNANKKEWLPDSVELMLTGYDHSPEKPLPWPALWPGLKDKSTVQRNPGLYSIYLDKKYFEEFLKLNASLNEKQAVLINGKKFSISYRLQFPNIR